MCVDECEDVAQAGFSNKAASQARDFLLLMLVLLVLLLVKISHMLLKISLSVGVDAGAGAAWFSDSTRRTFQRSTSMFKN